VLDAAASTGRLAALGALRRGRADAAREARLPLGGVSGGWQRRATQRETPLSSECGFQRCSAIRAKQPRDDRDDKGEKSMNTRAVFRASAPETARVGRRGCEPSSN
jgi:hypothetical protein